MKSLILIASMLLCSVSFATMELNTTNIREKLGAAKTNNKTIVITFVADWCDQCKAFKETLSKAEFKFKDMEFYTIDIDKSPELSEGVPFVPVTIIMTPTDTPETLKVIKGNADLEFVDKMLTLSEVR